MALPELQLYGIRPVREITQYWSMDGHPLAKADEFLDCYNAEHDAELMEKGIILEGKQIS